MDIVYIRDNTIMLGKQGEQNARKLIFPNNTQATTAAILHKRATDTNPYAVTCALSADGVEWVVQAVDVSVPGGGVAEVTYYKGNETLKSVTYKTVVNESVETGETIIPAPVAESILEQITTSNTAAVTAATNAASSAVNADASATSAGNSAATASAKADTARDYSQSAAGYANTASGSATTATNAATTAQAQAQAAQGSAESAQASATTATTKAAEAAQSATQAAQSATQAQADVTAETAARTAADAILTAQAQSTARSLDFLWKLNKGISYDFETDTTAAYSKTVPTGAKVCDVRSVGGKSIVWNQMVDTVRFTGFSANTISGGVRRLTAENNSNRVYFNSTTINASDVFYMCADVYGADGATVSFVPYNFGGYYQTKFSKNCTSNTLTRISLCCSFTNTKTQFQFTINGTYPIGISYVDGSFHCVNLTKMFGSGNEPTTTDDPRIAMIEAYAAEHPEYNEGEIISADVTAIDIVRADDSTTTITIPAAVRALEGYGWSAGTVFNEVDFASKKFIRRIQALSIVDGQLTATLYDTPIETDISALLADSTEDITVESGGSITMEQDGTQLAVPSKVEYLIALNEVTE